MHHYIIIIENHYKDIIIHIHVIPRLTKDANTFEGDLEVLRKAIGFGDYGKFEGDLGFHTYEVFRDCEFGATTPVVITDTPSETTETMTTTDGPTTTTEDIVTTETDLPTTTEEFIVGPIAGTTSSPINSQSKKRKRRQGTIHFNCLSFVVIDWLIDCLFDWLIDWLIDWLVGWLINSYLLISKW